MPVKISRRKIKDKLFGRTKNTAHGVQLAELADARLGAMYFLGNTKIEKVPAFSLDLIGTFVLNTQLASDLKTGCTFLLKKWEPTKWAMEAVSAKIDVVKEKLQHILADFFQYLTSKAKTVLGEALYGAEWLADFGTWAVSTFAGNLANLIPGLGYVQSAAELYSGARNAVVKSKDLIQQMWSGYGVELLGGQPSIIANALARHSAKGISGGIKDILVESGKIGATFAGDMAGGAGMIVSVLTDLLGKVASLVDYAIQRFKVNRVLSRAKKEWGNHLSSVSMVHNHRKFSEWFQDAVVCTPIIAALTLGSGFVGHPYRFLQLIQPDLSAVGQSEFDQGRTII